MFFDDAITASKVLSLVLTGRACGLEEKAPMCGVPYHAASGYIAKLVKAGYKVAVCEQTEDAAEAKGLVRREIVQIISPGTMTDSAYLNEKENNFLLCAYESALYTCLSYIDISTAECKTILFSALSNQSDLLSEIEKIAPAEVVCNEVFYDKYHRHRLFTSRLNIKLSLLDDEYFDYDTAKAILKNQLGPVGDTFFRRQNRKRCADQSQRRNAALSAKYAKIGVAVYQRYRALFKNRCHAPGCLYALSFRTDQKHARQQKRLAALGVGSVQNRHGRTKVEKLD